MWVPAPTGFLYGFQGRASARRHLLADVAGVARVARGSQGSGGRRVRRGQVPRADTCCRGDCWSPGAAGLRRRLLREGAPARRPAAGSRPRTGNRSPSSADGEGWASRKPCRLPRRRTTIPDRFDIRCASMFSLIYIMCKLTMKLCVWSVLVSVWLMWAMVVLPIALVASLTGNDRVARQWQRSLRWRWRF
jgi:hypothetical protein